MSEANVRLIIGLARAIAFIMGAGFSLTVGQIGMRMAVQANVRVASASRRSFGDALRIAYRAGTITGMLTDGLGLFGGTIIFIILGIAAPDALLGFGFGGTLLALFMRVGGGIFTKAADVGADLVGKVEAGHPRGRPAQPGRGRRPGGRQRRRLRRHGRRHLRELRSHHRLRPDPGPGAVAHHRPPRVDRLSADRARHRRAVVHHRHLRRARRAPGQGGDAMAAIFRGFLSSAAISAVLFFIAGFFYLNKPEMAQWGGWWRTPLAVAVGVLLAIVIDRLTEYFTGTHAAPVKEIKKGADTGPATLILQGMAVGYESSVWAVLVIALTIIASIVIFGTIPGIDPAQRVTFILYGVAMTGIGMLTLTGNNVAMDSFGPISDNANGIGEMAWSGLEDHETKAAQQIMADLDAVGNTTKAITKGVAIGSAVIAAVSLFGSFLVDVSRAQSTLGVPLAEQIGSAGHPRGHARRYSSACSSAARCPGCSPPSPSRPSAAPRPSSCMEARRQFRLGVLEGKVTPDYRQAVSISTTAAQKELHRPGPAGRRHAHRGRPAAAGGGAGRLPGRHHPLRPAAGRLHEQRRRRVGQRQEADRGRAEGPGARTWARAPSATRPAWWAIPWATR